MNRTEKGQVVSALHKTLSGTTLVVVTKQVGLTVAEVSNLRRKMRAAGAGYKVTKNRLARLALKGTKFERLEPLFKGPTAIAHSLDPVAAAKVAVEYAKDNDKLTILGGAFGELVLDAAGVKTLATLPSLDQLRGRIVGVLQAPATKVAAIMQAPAAKLARVLGAYAKKSEAA